MTRVNVSGLTASIARHHTPVSDQGAAAWLEGSTSIIRRHQTRNTGKDLGLAANATSIPANSQDLWGESYDKLRVVKASISRPIIAKSSPSNREHSGQVRSELSFQQVPSDSAYSFRKSITTARSGGEWPVSCQRESVAWRVMPGSQAEDATRYALSRSRINI